MVRCLHVAFQFGIAFCGAFGCGVEYLCGPRNCCQRKIRSSPADALFAFGSRIGLRLPRFDDCAIAVGDSNAIFTLCFDQSNFGIGGFDVEGGIAGKTEIYIGQLVEHLRSFGGFGHLYLDAQDVYGGDVCQ